jgi:predicted acyl esterase
MESLGQARHGGNRPCGVEARPDLPLHRGSLLVRRFAPLLFVLALIPSMMSLAPATAETVRTNEFTFSETFFPSGDGTSLHADVLKPKWAQPDDKFPVIVSIGPYFNSVDGGPNMRFKDLFDQGRIFERGFAYVQVDSRGYGGSAGCYDLGGDGEQADAKAAVEWAAKQPWSTGKVGMWGKSYDGWTQVMALAQDPVGLEAVVIQSPLIEAYRVIFENGVSFGTGWKTFANTYQSYDGQYNDPTSDNPEEFTNHVTGTAVGAATGCYAEHYSMTQSPLHDETPYWRERDLIVAASDTDVPVMWSHGFNDVNTKPNNFLPVWERLASPKHAWFGQWDHVRGNESDLVGRQGFMDEAMAFFTENLMDGPTAEFPGVEVQDGEGNWRTEDSWPPADATMHRFSLKPGSYTDNNANSVRTASAGSWTFTQPAPYDVRFSGPFEVAAQVATQVPYTNMVALLYDVAPDGKARFIQRGAKLIPGSGGVKFTSYPQDWILREGHRLGLLLAGNDSTQFFPANTNTTVQVLSGTLGIQALRYERTPNLAGGPAKAQGSVPVVTVPAATITSREVTSPFPPAALPAN